LKLSSIIQADRIEGLEMRLSVVDEKNLKQKIIKHLRAYQYDEAVILLEKIVGSL